MPRRPEPLRFALVLTALLSVSCATAGRGGTAAPAAGPQAPAASAAGGLETGGVIALPPARQLPLTSGEEAFLAARLLRPAYVVYYDESAGLDPRLARLAVGQANRYLRSREGLAAADVEAVAAAWKDAGTSRIATSGGSGRGAALRRLCLSLGADVYVELAFSLKSESRDGKYYALARGEMRILDVASASLLGTVAFEGQPAISPSSLEAAATNAVTQAVWLAMPSVTARARELLGPALRRGIAYELVIGGAGDRKAMESFARELSGRLREVASLPSAPGDYAFLLFDFLEPQKIEAAVREAAALAGLPALGAATATGRLFVFRLTQ